MYILDEIDAALDLSHTQHIGQLFRTRFKGSQFIVVSLKEGLFTNANVLFRTRFRDGTSIVERTAQRSTSALYADGDKENGQEEGDRRLGKGEVRVLVVIDNTVEDVAGNYYISFIIDCFLVAHCNSLYCMYPFVFCILLQKNPRFRTWACRSSDPARHSRIEVLDPCSRSLSTSCPTNSDLSISIQHTYTFARKTMAAMEVGRHRT